jgi:V/A-type H+/Na+-transporting ATPase subunit F
LYRVLAITREDLGAGFALAGVEVTRAPTPEEARTALAGALQGGGYGVVILEQELLSGMDEETRAEALASTVPLVIAIPGEMRWRETEEAPADDYVARLIRRAVGYQLNIRL